MQVLYIDTHCLMSLVEKCLLALSHSIGTCCSCWGNQAKQLSPELGADTESEGLQREPVGAVKTEGHGGVAFKAALVQQDG